MSTEPFGEKIMPSGNFPVALTRGAAVTPACNVLAVVIGSRVALKVATLDL